MRRVACGCWGARRVCVRTPPSPLSRLSFVTLLGCQRHTGYVSYHGCAVRHEIALRALRCQRRSVSDDSGTHNEVFSAEAGFVEDSADLQTELASALEAEVDGGGVGGEAGELPRDEEARSAAVGEPVTTRITARVGIAADSPVQLERLDRPPGRFDLLSNSLVYRWQTTAALARKISGPMREWASELKYRTGVHLELEPTFPERLIRSPSEGGYAIADEVDITVYLFGSERSIFNCHALMEAALRQDPAYVRLGVFRRVPKGVKGHGGDGDDTAVADVEWLMLRRINRELRPPDIPPISLKLPGKWSLMYEEHKEAAIRTLWEETGITVDAAKVYPTARLQQSVPMFYWRVPVYYFVAEVPYEVEVKGPQVVLNSYMHDWDSRLLRQSPDPIDRAWAQLADPATGCAWMGRDMIDTLQQPLRGEDYMALRYTPPPYTKLGAVLGFDGAAGIEDGGTQQSPPTAVTV